MQLFQDPWSSQYKGDDLKLASLDDIGTETL
jgi:hypothetical protein